MLLCCHPALHPDAQVALTLRLVGGLTTAEIAAAYLLPEATITQRIVRAKRKIRDAGIPLRIPERLDERVDVLLGVLYLVFNEGYLARGDATLRVDLADEAIRLTRVAHDLAPDSGEAGGLLALMLFQRARFATRVDRAGDLVLLEHQDRTRWDAATIAEGNRVLAAALRLQTARPPPAAGRGRRPPRQRPHLRRHRLAGDRRGLLRARPAHRLPGRAAQPRRRGRPGRRAARRAAAPRRDHRPRRLPPAARDPRRAAPPGR